MFTGLIEKLVPVVELRSDGSGGALLTLRDPALASELIIGESVAVNGTCLTVVHRDAETFHFELGPETLQRTCLSDLHLGDQVNIERALRVGDRLGGHFVQGHVDGVGVIVDRIPQGEWETVWFRCPSELSPLMVPKGSIAVDGISLTLVDLDVGRFSVMLIPHTLAVTTLGRKKIGDRVNLEADMIAKHVQKLLTAAGKTSLWGEVKS